MLEGGAGGTGGAIVEEIGAGGTGGGIDVEIGAGGSGALEGGGYGILIGASEATEDTF